MDDKTPAIIQRIRDRNAAQADAGLAERQHAEKLISDNNTQQTFIEVFRAFVEYLEGRTSKVEVTNQLDSIGTPDALKVAEEVSQLHETIKNQPATDLSEVTQVMRDVLAEMQSLPKDQAQLELPDEFKISNLPDNSQELKDLLEAVKAINLVAEAPVVNLPAAVVKVDAPDLKPLDKGMSSIEKAVKAIPKADNSGLEKLLKATNKQLKAILDKPTGGSGGGGGGLATPYKDPTGMPYFPVYESTLDKMFDDVSTTLTYVGKARPGTATSAPLWQIKKIDSASGTSIRYASGSAEFNQIWDNRASLTY